MITLTENAKEYLTDMGSKSEDNDAKLSVKGGGCAGFEYIFDSVNHDGDSNDVYIDFGKFGVVIDKVSVPYLVGMTLDYVKEGLNEIFKFINPKEKSSCGCGVSINFDLDQVEVDKEKIFAVDLS